MELTAIEVALASIGELTTSALGVITGNEILMVFFCAGLLGVGFRVISSAKHTAM